MIELDTNQKQAVNTLENVVVSAGAGSGKTRVLAERFLHLIELGCKVDRILTLTFTNKAAVEMKERIFKTLKDTKTANAQAALKDFDKAHIQTLDSYFSDVAKSGAHYYGITPAFSLDEDSINSTIYTHALEYILERKDNQAIKAMTKSLRVDELAKEVFASSILRYTTVVDTRDFVKDAEKQYAEIARVWSEKTKQADSIVEEFFYALHNYEGGAKGVYELQEKLKPLTIIKGSSISADKANCAKMEEYVLFLSAILKENVPKAKDRVAECFKALYSEANGNIYKTLASCLDFMENYDTAKGIAQLLNEFQTQVNDTKRTSGKLTFKDVSHLAFTTLREHSDIRHTEQAKFDKIMIDEFQDNDQMQCDVLFMLSDENEKTDENGLYIIPNFDKDSDNYIQKRLGAKKLFFVGDEKQSIYRFRNADVSVFRALQEHLGKRLEMDINYRSKPNLIQAFNTLFGGDNEEGKESIFFTKENASDIPTFEAVYEKVKVPQSKIDEGDSENRVCVALYEGEEDINTKENRLYQARYIAKKINELKGQGYKYSDIALLFRAATNLSIYSKELLKANIPYSTEVYNGFYADGPINDLVSYLKLCAYPDDANALVKVLHSSFVNLNLEDSRALSVRLKAIKREITDTKEERENSTKSYAPFDDEAEKVAREFFGEDTESFRKFQFAKENFAHIKETLKTQSLTEVIYRLWNDLGYRFETMWNSDVSMYSSLYDILTELARLSEKNNNNLSSFIDAIEEYKDNTAKIDGLNIPQEASDSVKILTIHKSKGLEFKVVFVCDIAAQGTIAKMPQIFFSEDFGFVLTTPSCASFDKFARMEKTSNLNYFYTLSRSKEEAEEIAELKRVTYVAFTRAEEKLFIVGGEKPNTDKQKDSSSAKKTMYAMLKPFLLEEGEKPFLLETFDQNTESKDNAAAKEKFANDSISKERFIAEHKSIFENAEIEKEYTVLPLHISPSSFEHTSVFSASKAESTPPEWTNEIDRIVKESIPKTEQADFNPDDTPIAQDEESPDVIGKAKPRFGYNTFGTIAHKFLEQKFANENKIAIDTSLYDGIARETDEKVIQGICERMASEFEETELCKRAKAAVTNGNALAESEYKFRSALDFTDKDGKKQKIVLSGTMDLVFQNESGAKYTYTIVDYKTDRAINTEKYIPQLSCYRSALAQILDCDENAIECVLYYLRYAKAVDISDACKQEIAENELKRLLLSYKM